MTNLFVTIFLFSIVTLIIGLVKPSLLKLTRKRISIIFGSIIFLSLILIGITAPKTTNRSVEDSNNQSVQQTNSTSTPEKTNSKIVVSQDEDIKEVQVNTTKQDLNTSASSQYGVRSKTGGCVGNKDLPDSGCTPGAIFQVTSTEICVSGYSSSVRNVTDSVRKEVFAEYGIPYSEHSNYEVDHLISLELGGSNDISNLWPEPYNLTNGARVKDKLENYLHKQVCDGKLTLEQAQYQISHNWIAYYDQMPKTTPTYNSTSSSQPTTQASVSGKYYTSSYSTSKYYYPASCDGWKSLNSSYLKSFDTLDALLKAYPSRTESPQCN